MRDIYPLAHYVGDNNKPKGIIVRKSFEITNNNLAKAIGVKELKDLVRENRVKHFNLKEDKLTKVRTNAEKLEMLAEHKVSRAGLRDYWINDIRFNKIDIENKEKVNVSLLGVREHSMRGLQGKEVRKPLVYCGIFKVDTYTADELGFLINKKVQILAKNFYTVLAYHEELLEWLVDCKEFSINCEMIKHRDSLIDRIILRNTYNISDEKIEELIKQYEDIGKEAAVC